MDRMDLYYSILTNIHRQCQFLFLAYCLVMWVKPFLPRGAKVYRVGVAYVAAMMITYYIPLVMSGKLAYGIGIGTAFLVMYLLDREYIGQKIFLAVTFNCLRWQIYWIIIIIMDMKMWIWSQLYLYTMERGNIPWIFDMFGMQWFWLDVMGTIVEMVIEFLFMYGAVRFMLHAYGRKREHMGIKEFVLLVMPVVSGLAGEEITRYHRNIYERETGKSLYDLSGYDPLVTLYAVICFATILTMTYVYRRWKNEREEDTQREVFARQMTDMENHITQVERLYRDMRSLRHDMGNHLMTLRQLYSKGEHEAAEQYARTLHAQVQDTSADVPSGNPVTDVILSGRKKEMEEKGIVFECNFHYPQDGNINAFDISVILNNGLSNAIEAVERERGESAADSSDENDISVIPYIFVSSYRAKNMYIIEIANDYAGELVTDPQSGLPLSAKSGMGHGFGLANIRRVAQKYLGDIEIGKEKYSDRDCFVLRVMMQMTDKNATG